MSIFTRKLLRDMKSQRAQFAAVALTVGLGVALFGASFDAYRTLQHSYRTLSVRLKVPSLWVVGGDSSAIAAYAAAQPGVAAVERRVRADIPIRVGPTALLARVIGTTDQVAHLDVLRGAGLRPGDQGGVLVERHLADHFHLRQGQRVVVEVPGHRYDLQMRGVVSSAEYLWPARSRAELFTSPDQFGIVFVDDTVAARLAGPSAVNETLVRYTGETERATLDARLRGFATAHGAVDTYTWADQPSNSALQEDVRGFGELAVLFPALFLLGAGLAAWGLLTRLVFSQRRIIGTLTASGASPRSVRRHYVSYGVLGALMGAVPGALLGLALATLLAHLYTSALALPFTTVRLTPLTPLLGIVVAVVAGALAARGPARRAAALDPVEAMRGTTATTTSPVHGLGGIARRLPAVPLLVIRNIVRERRRTATTVLAVVLSLVLVLVGWGMLDTVRILTGREFSHIERQDATLVVADGQGVNAAIMARSLGGVARVEHGAQVALEVRAGGHHTVTVLRAFETNTRMHQLGAGTPAGVPPSGIVLGKLLAHTLSAHIGDRVAVAPVASGRATTMRVTAIADDPLGTFAYASLDAAAPLLGPGSGATNELLVQYQAGVARPAIARRLGDLPAVLAVQDTTALANTVRGFLRLFDVIVGAMLVAGALLAVGLIYTGVTVTLAQRTFELAVYDALGVRRRSIVGLVSCENALVAAASLLPGVAVGWLAAKGFMASFQSDQFSFPLTMRPSTPWLASVLVITVVSLAHVPALRQLGHMETAHILRQRAP